MLRVLIPLTAVLLVIFGAAHAALGVIICAGLLAYFVSLVIAPKRKCVSCKGGKVHGDVLPTGGVRRCWTCKGRGEYARWGTILLRRNVHQQIRDGKHGRNY